MRISVTLMWRSRAQPEQWSISRARNALAPSRNCASRRHWLDQRAQERVNPCAPRARTVAARAVDERNLIDLSSPDYPGERLVACRNPDLANWRAHKREELLAATEKNLQKINARVDAGQLSRREELGLRVGKVIIEHQVAKHFELAIGDNAFTFVRKDHSFAAEAALDGVYIIRTSVSGAQMDAAQCVRNYKVSLASLDVTFAQPVRGRTGRCGAYGISPGAI